MQPLSALLLTYHHIDPVIFQIGSFAVRWYSLAYVTGIVLGWAIIQRLNRQPVQGAPVLMPKAIDDMMIYAIIGIILGGRLGYVLFYKPDYYFDNPMEILHVWQGGMSFHGGLLGTIFAYYLFSRRFKLSFFAVMDLMAAVAPIGIGLGRLANFINGELYGRVTDAPLGMVFPTGGPEPRHPSQLYEATLEGLVLLILLYTLARYTRIRQYVGALSGLFLIGYSLARMTVEQFREPDVQLGFLFAHVTMGQLLSAPMLLVGAFLIYRSGLCAKKQPS